MATCVVGTTTSMPMPKDENTILVTSVKRLLNHRATRLAFDHIAEARRSEAHGYSHANLQVPEAARQGREPQAASDEGEPRRVHRARARSVEQAPDKRAGDSGREHRQRVDRHGRRAVERKLSAQWQQEHHEALEQPPPGES